MNIRAWFPRILRPLCCAALALAVVHGSAALAQRSIPVDRVVAVVGDEVITYLQLRDGIRNVVGQLQQQNIELPPVNVLEEQVLERMILERAQLQAARERGIRVDDATMAR